MSLFKNKHNAIASDKFFDQQLLLKRSNKPLIHLELESNKRKSERKN